MKALSSKFLFNHYNDAVGFKKYMETSVTPTDPKVLADEIETITKRFSFPTKIKVINDLNTHRLQLVTNPEVKIPTSIPAFLKVANGKVISVVNLTNYSKQTRDKSGTVKTTIDSRQLFACMQTGSILLTCFEKWNSIAMNQSICKIGASLYSRVTVKVLDKMFAVNMDAIKSDKLRFVMAKFFLMNLLEKPESISVDNLAYAACTNGTTRATIDSFNQLIPITAYEDIKVLLDSLAVNVEGLHTITLRTYLDSFMKMYGTSAILALEYFPFFCHMLFAVAIGARINSEFVLESLLGKDLDKFYTEFAGLMR